MSGELTSYAVSESFSKGRKFSEAPHPYRSDFDRDRDRVIHCQAFRRMEGKTQVFTPQLDGRANDSFRNRLTHSIEVAQIGRTIAKMLHLNENLTECLCLAHDLGHSPFGHAGEKILNDLMAGFGGFEHNSQTLRVVDLLEHPYPNFTGLNLMYETRLGLAKHQSPYDKMKIRVFSETNCSLEGQVTDIADRIAYNCHDLEDGMRAGLISNEQLQTIEIFAHAQSRINAKMIKDQNVLGTRTSKAIIDALVSDCIETSTKTIAKANIKTLDDVYNQNGNLVMLSDKSGAELADLESFLLKNFYTHKSIIRTIDKVEIWLGQLFGRLCKNPSLMPEQFQRLIGREGPERTVCDYIAGMTDRFCLKMLDVI